MSTALALSAPLLATGLVAVNIITAVRGPGRLRRMGRAVLRGLHRKAECVELSWAPAESIRRKEGGGFRAWIHLLTGTRTGLWGLLSVCCFLVLWCGDWVSPRYTLGFFWHLLGSWIVGTCAATALFTAVWAGESAWRMGRARIFAARAGLRRMWMAGVGRRSRFGRALLEAASDAKRIDILEFTGYELLARGPTEEGGVLAHLLSRFPEKEVRLLLFNPCAREVDPDRKHTTVIQSQLGAMEMSREAFESKIRATLDRVEVLNRNRERCPIEVRLYAEKPSFRVLVLGDVSFLGAIDPRDAAGELPLYEARRQSAGPSLHAAAHAHFVRVWGDSIPVEVETTSTVSPPPRAAAHRPKSAVVRRG